MSDDLTPLQKIIYAERDPIDHAVWLITMHLETTADILIARQTNPNAYPIVRLPITLDSVVHRIVGELIEAGWKPPAVREIPNDLSTLDTQDGPQ